MWAETECAVHLAPLKRHLNQFQLAKSDRQQALRAYCSNIHIYCVSYRAQNGGDLSSSEERVREERFELSVSCCNIFFSYQVNQDCWKHYRCWQRIWKTNDIWLHSRYFAKLVKSKEVFFHRSTFLCGQNIRKLETVPVLPDNQKRKLRRNNWNFVKILLHIHQKWYFVTKTVLTYCEKKLFYWLRKTSWFEVSRTIYSSNERS